MGLMSIETVNDNTVMIDFEMSGVKRIGVIYLISGEKKCLIDSGTRESSKRVINALDSINAFPPDIIILTHSHWDHTQGVPVFCREAEKRGQRIAVMASDKAISNLKDQSWNRVFDEKLRYENIADVEPLKDGQRIGLGGLELEIIDFSGHCADDIAIYDTKNRSIFLGDSLGYKFEHRLLFPPFLPPFWNKEGFYRAAENLKKMDYKTVCLAHFGCLEGKEAREFPREAVTAMETWWNVFVESEKTGKLDDIRHIRKMIVQEAKIEMPDIEISRPSIKMMLLFINICRKLLGKTSIDPGMIQLERFIQWLSKGYVG